MRNTVHSGRNTVRFITYGALIAALYVALTYLCGAVGLSSGVIQVRLSEALCVLTFFTPAAVPGIWLGCLLANLLMGAPALDIVGGSFASLLGAAGGLLFARLSRRAQDAASVRRARILRLCIPLPTVLCNALIIPFILKFAYRVGDAVPFLILTVGIGETVSACGGGLPLLWGLRKRFSRYLTD